jgi:hypothetical protein
MGEQFLKAQAKGFRHRHDMARDRFATPNLLTTMRTNGTATDCRCRVIGAAQAPDVGAGVVLRAAGETRADVICGNAIVGTVEGADVQALAPAFSAGAGVLRGTVQRAAVLGGLYTVRVTEGVQ